MVRCPRLSVISWTARTSNILHFGVLIVSDVIVIVTVQYTWYSGCLGESVQCRDVSVVHCCWVHSVVHRLGWTWWTCWRSFTSQLSQSSDSLLTLWAPGTVLCMWPRHRHVSVRRFANFVDILSFCCTLAFFGLLQASVFCCLSDLRMLSVLTNDVKKIVWSLQAF